DIGDGGIQFPAQAIVQRQVGPQFPAILGEEVQRRGAHVFALGGSLQVVIGKPQQVIGNEVGIPHVVGSTPEKVLIPIGGKIQRLVKLLAAHVRSELQGVVPLDLAETVRRLESVSELR